MIVDEISKIYFFSLVSIVLLLLERDVYVII